MATDSPGRMYSLDALRGVAALCVASLHAGQAAGVALAPSAYLAVDLFFLLSGFVLAAVYTDRFRAGLHALDFMRLRVIRFYPLYILGIALGAVAHMAGAILGQEHAYSTTDVAISFLISLLFLPTLLTGAGVALFPLNPPAWSLFFELIVNAGLPCKRLTRGLLLTVIALSGAVLVTLTLQKGSAMEGFTWETAPLGLVRAVFSFSVGALIFQIRPQRRSSSSLGAAVLPLAALAGLLSVAPSQEWRAVFDLGFIVILSPLIVLVCYRNEVPLQFAVVATGMGVASFALYAIHAPLILIAKGAAGILGLPAGVMIALALVGAIAATPLLDRFYDRPFRYVLSRIGRRVPSAA